MTSVCRLCLNPNASSYETITSIEEKYFLLILPEIDIQLVQSAIVCQNCTEVLQNCYMFKTKCLETEKMLKEYASNHAGGNIVLSDVLQKHTVVNEDIKVESDSESLKYDLDVPEDDLESKTEVYQAKSEIDCLENSLDTLDNEENKTQSNKEQLERPFKCNLCPKAYSLRKTLLDHVRTHFIKSDCKLCGKPLSNIAVLRRHLLGVHKIKPGDESWRDQLLIDESAMKEALSKHSKLYDKCSDYIKTINCNICNKVYYDKCALRLHIRSHFTKSDCKICRKQFYNVSTLKRHVTRIHTGEEDTWSDHISVVEDIPAIEEALKQHNMLDLNNGSESHICNICGIQLGNKDSLRKHTVIHTSDKLFTCEYCDKKFRTNTKLKIHISHCHLGVPRKRKRNRNYTCDTCGLRTASNHTLEEHIRTHTGERPFKCDLCGKRFAQSSSLGSHMRTTHSNERLFTCEYCSRSFKLKGCLNKHIQQVHMSDKIEKKFSCSYCGKKFLMQCQLKKHAQWHIADRKFSCDICGKKFVCKSSVKKHRAIHFPEKPHKCEICGKGFHQKSNIKIHMKVHGIAL